jgi:PiT family inorganic phosphate transporter
VLDKLENAGMEVEGLEELRDRKIAGSVEFRNALRQRQTLSGSEERFALSRAEIFPLAVEPGKIATLSTQRLSALQVEALWQISGRSFDHKWQLQDALAERSDAWRMKEANRRNAAYNQKLQEQLDYLYRVFHLSGS